MITKDMELFVDECVEYIKILPTHVLENDVTIIKTDKISGKWFSEYVQVRIDNKIDSYGCVNGFACIKINYVKIRDDAKDLPNNNDVYYQIRFILLHELVHAFDQKLKLNIQSKKSYYLKPTEIDAYVYPMIFCIHDIKDVMETKIYKMYSNNKHIKRKILKTFYKLKGNLNAERNARR